jgi:hypothetical protein
LPWIKNLWPTLLVGLSVAMAGAVSLAGLHKIHPAVGFGMASAGGLVHAAVVALVLADSRRELVRAWRVLRTSGWRSLIGRGPSAAAAAKPVPS